MRLTKPAALALTAVLLAACGSSDDADPTPAPSSATTTTPDDATGDTGDATGDADADDEELSLDDLLGQTEITLAVGDCWGREDEIELDPIPCDGPHIYEVAAIIEDWPYEQYEGGFEKGVEGDEAQRDACNAAARTYFGGDFSEQGITVAHNQPQFMGHEDTIVCSAHGAPDTEIFREEVTGSYESRGLR